MPRETNRGPQCSFQILWFPKANCPPPHFKTALSRRATNPSPVPDEGNRGCDWPGVLPTLIILGRNHIKRNKRAKLPTNPNTIFEPEMLSPKGARGKVGAPPAREFGKLKPLKVSFKAGFQLSGILKPRNRSFPFTTISLPKGAMALSNPKGRIRENIRDKSPTLGGAGGTTVGTKAGEGWGWEFGPFVCLANGRSGSGMGGAIVFDNKRFLGNPWKVDWPGGVSFPSEPSRSPTPPDRPTPANFSLRKSCCEGSALEIKPLASSLRLSTPGPEEPGDCIRFSKSVFCWELRGKFCPSRSFFKVLNCS